MTILKPYFTVLTLCAAVNLAACGTAQLKPQTLGDIDTRPEKLQPAKPRKSQSGGGGQLADKDAIKRAYYDYIRNAEDDDPMRIHAATRIAELEMELDSKITKESPAQTAKTDRQFDQTIQQTIALLNDALKDFPDAPGNDHTLYQLAKAYDQVGEADEAVATLNKLVKRYPDSPYFVEAKFRIGEKAFLLGRYDQAEKAYSDVLNGPDNQRYYEKALFKRGWAYYKQEQYTDALDDYFEAVEIHDFRDVNALAAGEQEIFNEYYRAVGLAFLYQGGADAIAGYFDSSNETQNVYLTFQTLAELQLKQEHYSDAVDTYQAYIDQYPQGRAIADAQLNIVEIWKQAGFFNQYVGAFEDFYNGFNPNATVWNTGFSESTLLTQQSVDEALRENVRLLAGHFHNRYKKTANPSDFRLSQTWYQRYLAHFENYAQQDDLYPAYALLLKEAGRYEQALVFFEKAAFDGDIVLDKDSAYNAIYLTDLLMERQSQEPPPNSSYDEQYQRLLNKHIEYAKSYSKLYPSDSYTASVVQNAVQMAYREQRYLNTIDLANTMPDSATVAQRREVDLLKAQSYFNLEQFEEAELMYQDLLEQSNYDLAQREQRDIENRLALTIYNQAEAAAQNDQIEMAARDYVRVYQQVPTSDLAPTSLYDAAALFMGNRRWEEAINFLEVFRSQYPEHALQKDVSRKLSVAYLEADRNIDAAREFEKLSTYMDSEEEKMAALWQAAELYRERADWINAARAYKDYAYSYKRPYAQNVEAMFNLAGVYQKLGEKDKRIYWLKQIIDADNKVTTSRKTPRTEFVAADAAFALAKMKQEEFNQIALVLPLDQTLRAKKQAMQDTVRLFGKASLYGHEDFVTQSTYQIGKIYRDFARALLASERPRNLNAEELNQYNILLEDQAFPFEDKAIEFYEVNIARIRSGIFDSWVEQSLTELATLYPARYDRAGKIESSIEVF